jgi:hypothetical protein
MTRARRQTMKANTDGEKAIYFGIEVEILVSMEHCCLVRFRDKEFVVETADLAIRLAFAKAA